MTKFTTLLLATLGLTSISASNFLSQHTQELKELWSTWKSLNNKAYSESEDIKRFGTFVENFAKVTQHNSKNSGTKLSLNKFADLTEEEFASQYGNPLLGTEISKAKNESHNIDYSILSLPDKVDWRAKGAVGPIKNQNGCPNCYTFSAIGALETLNWIKTGKLLVFAEQQIQDCDKGSHGCSGGFRDSALAYAAANGVELESDYPYIHKDAPCKYEASKAHHVSTGYKRIKPNDVDAVKVATAVQPVSAILQATEDSFKLYKSGVIKTGCGVAVNHGVLIVGYDVIDGEEVFIVKNSWGDAWGMKGYAYVSADRKINDGKGVCGILVDPMVPTK